MVKSQCRKRAAAEMRWLHMQKVISAPPTDTIQEIFIVMCRAVLVGDPQQLPATVKSQRGKELQLERSLFERLQKGGCPVKVLSVQYRMHPEIRIFPSNYFYGGRLEDG